MKRVPTYTHSTLSWILECSSANHDLRMLSHPESYDVPVSYIDNASFTLCSHTEGVSYLVILGIIGWSIYTKVSTGATASLMLSRRDVHLGVFPSDACHHTRR